MIHVLTCFYLRPQITEYYLQGFERLRKNFDISYTFVVSEDSDKELLESKGYTVVVAPNYPLSNKWNTGLFEALKHKWDYLLIMGSDDLITNNGLQRLIDAKKDYVGYKSIYFVNTFNNYSMGLYTYNMDRLVGCGRLISRTAIENTCFRGFVSFRKDRNIQGEKYRIGNVFETSERAAKHLVNLKYANGYKKVVRPLWNEGLDSGLDSSSELNLCVMGYAPHFLEGVEMVDIKSDTGVTKWNNLLKEGMIEVGSIDLDIEYPREVLSSDITPQP